MSLGTLISESRKNKGMTMQELGKAVGVQASAVNKWEKGIVSNIKQSTLIKIAEVLEIDMDLMFSEAFATSYDSKAIQLANELYEEFSTLNQSNQAAVRMMIRALNDAQQK